MLRHSLAGLALFFASTPAAAQDGQTDPAKAQFETIASWEGRWKVAETDALTIVFEITARGSTVVERWETASGLHSMTIYHLDGDRIMATHYCPQGNQPRLVSVGSENNSIAFAFHDISGLDDGESHSSTLRFDMLEDGSLTRTDVYSGPDGPGGPHHYTLSRLSEAQ